MTAPASVRVTVENGVVTLEHIADNAVVGHGIAERARHIEGVVTVHQCPTRPRHARRAWKREAPGGERLPFVYGRFPGRDQTYAWWSGSLSPKMCAAYAAACVRRSMPSFWNRADT
jgi:hypothetical protein